MSNVRVGIIPALAGPQTNLPTFRACLHSASGNLLLSHASKHIRLYYCTICDCVSRWEFLTSDTRGSRCHHTAQSCGTICSFSIYMSRAEVGIGGQNAARGQVMFILGTRSRQVSRTALEFRLCSRKSTILTPHTHQQEWLCWPHKSYV